MLIPNICQGMNLTPKKTAIVQITICSLVYISMLVFPNFFVTLSIYIVFLFPLWVLSVYLFQNIYQGITQLNLA